MIRLQNFGKKAAVDMNRTTWKTVENPLKKEIKILQLFNVAHLILDLWDFGR